MLDEIPARAGTYLLLLHSNASQSVTVGRRGQLALVSGYYIYIGSAFGPGGLQARIRHHHGISQRPHWHLDYIRPYLNLLEIWYSTDNERYEHAWAESMVYNLRMQVPMPGLGSSDCQCESHFFFTTEMLEAGLLHEALAIHKKKTKLERLKLNEESVG